MDFEFFTNETSLTFKVNRMIYPLQVIMKTAYIFTNNFYIFFDYTDEIYIKVQLKSRGETTINELECNAGEFFNQLLHHRIRFDIQNETKDLRQLILGRALYTECIEVKNESIQKENSVPTVDESINTEEDYDSDCYRISQSWDDNMRCVENGNVESDST